MKKNAVVTALFLTGSMTLMAGVAQTVGSDLKDAGKKSTSAVKTGAVKTKNGVKAGTHKAASATAKGANKVKAKTTSTGTSN